METGVNPPVIPLINSAAFDPSALCSWSLLASPVGSPRSSSSHKEFFHSPSWFLCAAPCYLALCSKILPSSHMLLEPVADVKAVIRWASCPGDVSSWLCVSRRGQNQQHKKSTTNVNQQRIHSSGSHVMWPSPPSGLFTSFTVSWPLVISPPLNRYSIMILSWYYLQFFSSVGLDIRGWF